MQLRVRSMFGQVEREISVNQGARMLRRMEKNGFG